MNQLTIIGNLTRDPETRSTKDGDSVTNFTVAVNRSSGDADFFRVACWGNLGENCAKYLSKGKKVAVIGSVYASAYEDSEGNPAASLEVSAARVEFLSPVASNEDDSKRNKSTRNNSRR